MATQNNLFAGTALVQNFEANSRGLAAFAVEETNATVALSSDVAHSGTYSLKTNITTAGGQAHIGIGGGAESHTTDVYVRFWVYITSAMFATIANGEYYDFFHFTDSGYGIVWILGVTSDTNKYFRIDADDFAGANVATFVADRWYCIEVYVDQDAAAGVITMWVDGVQVKSETGLDTGDPGFYFRVGGGGWWSDGVTGAMYIDDIVIDTNYIGTGYRIQEGVAVGSLPYF